MNRFKNILSKLLKKNKRPIVSQSVVKSKPILSDGFDLIGPADKISNLRSFRYYIPKNESKLEYDYRMLREKIFDFNHQYWTQQNLQFIESKKKFIEKYRIEQKYLNYNRIKDEEIADPDMTQMNEFYKDFLNKNTQVHYDYNRKWFKYNLQLLWPATKVFFFRLNKKLTLA